jgi:hypothetical protein
MKQHRFGRERRQAFLGFLAETGNVTESARLVGTSRSRVYEIRLRDALFREAWEEAEAIACERLEAEARRRALEGVPEPLISAGRLVCDADGNPVIVRRYSDTLLITLLKAHNPERFDRRTAAEPGRPPLFDARTLLLARLEQMAAAEPEPAADAVPALPEPPSDPADDAI